MQNHAVEQLAQLALDYVLDPPSGADPVIRLSEPDELMTDPALGLALGEITHPHAPADLVAAATEVMRRSVHTTHPRFFNQNFAGADPFAVVGDWLAAALNTTGATYEAAPVFTLMEDEVIGKLARLAGYDGHTSLAPGLFAPGGSTATLYALQLARHRIRPDVVEHGTRGERLVCFVSSAAHYAAGKSMALLGLGSAGVVEVAGRTDGSMDPAALDAAIDTAIAAGSIPFAVIATAGTTVTAAFDDIDAIAGICSRRDIWLHVDGAYGASALFSEKHRGLLRGVSRSDSLVWNLHKMMGMTQQCTVLLVKDPDQLIDCFGSGADYLFQTDKLHADLDSGDRTFQCARRIDVLKAWLAWKAHGDAGFAGRVDHAVDLADHTRRAIDASGGVFAMLPDGGFTNVVFLWVPPELRPLDPLRLDDATRRRLHRIAPAIKAAMLADGGAMVGYQPVHGVNAFRLLFMNPAVTPGDVDATLTLIDDLGARVVEAGG